MGTGDAPAIRPWWGDGILDPFLDALLAAVGRLREAPSASARRAVDDAARSLRDEARRVGVQPGGAAAGGVEALLDRPATRLAVYGSLAPGGSYHDLLAQCAGPWIRAAVRGDRDPEGWGRTGGYPGLRWDPLRPPRPVWLLASTALGRHWARLDAFEGPAYVRILVPVELPAGGRTVANLYRP